MLLFSHNSTNQPSLNKNPISQSAIMCIHCISSLILFADSWENPVMLDAPVSGGVLAADAGTLTFMVWFHFKPLVTLYVLYFDGIFCHFDSKEADAAYGNSMEYCHVYLVSLIYKFLKCERNEHRDIRQIPWTCWNLHDVERGNLLWRQCNWQRKNW